MSITLSAQGGAGGLLIGGDSNLYRFSADVFRTPDADPDITPEELRAAFDGLVADGLVSELMPYEEMFDDPKVWWWASHRARSVRDGLPPDEPDKGLIIGGDFII